MTRLTGLVTQEHLDKLEITYEDLAKVYFLLGNTNGRTTLWGNVEELLDEGQVKYEKFVTQDKWSEGLASYVGVEEEWLSLFLTQEQEVNENKELIDELNSVIMKAQEQIEILTTKEEV